MFSERAPLAGNGTVFNVFAGSGMPIPRQLRQSPVTLNTVPRRSLNHGRLRSGLWKRHQSPRCPNVSLRELAQSARRLIVGPGQSALGAYLLPRSDFGSQNARSVGLSFPPPAQPQPSYSASTSPITTTGGSRNMRGSNGCKHGTDGNE